MDDPVCQLCPKADRVPATRTHTDSQGYVYRLCQKHYAPIQQWRNKQSAPKGGE